jgi:sigma-B regulation protein RsbU (phosphoserine phosphatase)
MTMVICRSLTTKIITGNSYRLLEPEEVLARLNRDMIRRQGRTTRFATAVYAIVNCRSREVRLAGAGHPPPLLLGADGSSRAIEPAGGLLGVFEDETYAQVSFEIAVGDRLLMYSDGFEQAFPTAQADAYERKLPNNRYREEFEQLAAASSPTDMVKTISQRLDDQTGSLHQLDDLTMLCMRAGPLVTSADAEPGVTADTTGSRLHLA